MEISCFFGGSDFVNFGGRIANEILTPAISGPLNLEICGLLPFLSISFLSATIPVSIYDIFLLQLQQTPSLA